MAVTTCWNCRNPVSGAVCPTCGAQQAMSAPPMPPYPPNPPAQPSVSQASMSVRQGPPMYVPGGQPGVRDYEAQDAINARYAQRGQPPAGSYPMGGQPYGASGPFYGPPGQQPYGPNGAAGGWQQPVALIGQPAGAQPATGAPATSAAAGFGLRVVLAAVSGFIAAVLGALVWAFLLNATKTNYYILGVLLGFVVAIGVLLGARNQRHLVFVALAGVLGLLCFGMALYFRLSLAYSDSLFGLPFSDFSPALKDYLSNNPINYLNFAAVPLVAIIATYRGFHPRVARRLR